MLTKEEIEDRLAEVGELVNLSNEQYDELLDNGKLEIDLSSNKDNTTSSNTDEQDEIKEFTETSENKIFSKLKSNSLFGYKKYHGKVWQLLAKYLEKDYIITEAIVRSGHCAYKTTFYMENNELWGDSDLIQGQEIKLLDMISRDMDYNCTGMDGRDCDSYYLKRLDNNKYLLEIIVYNGKQRIEGKYTLEKRKDFLGKYGIEI